MIKITYSSITLSLVIFNPSIVYSDTLSLVGKNVGVGLCLNNPLCAGHRLISINSTSLEGVSHQAALEILENAPEDVTLVISQPKDKLSKGRVAVSAVSSPASLAVCSEAE